MTCSHVWFVSTFTISHCFSLLLITPLLFYLVSLSLILVKVPIFTSIPIWVLLRPTSYVMLIFSPICSYFSPCATPSTKFPLWESIKAYLKCQFWVLWLWTSFSFLTEQAIRKHLLVTIFWHFEDYTMKIINRLIYNKDNPELQPQTITSFHIFILERKVANTQFKAELQRTFNGFTVWNVELLKCLCLFELINVLFDLAFCVCETSCHST